MTRENCLNEILRELIKNHITINSQGVRTYHGNKPIELGEPEYHIDEFLEELIKEGFVRPHQRYINERCYSITDKGERFIKNGGYNWRYRTKKFIGKHWKESIPIVISIVAVVASILTSTHSVASDEQQQQQIDSMRYELKQLKLKEKEIHLDI